MSISSDLRLIASAVDQQREAFERLHFCASAHLNTMREIDPKERRRTLQQLNDAVKATARFL